MMLQSGFQANAAIKASSATHPGLSVNDFSLDGGWVIIPILLLALLALYVFIDRLVAIGKANIDDKNYMNRVREFIHDRKIEAAVRLSDTSNSPVSRMIGVGITRIGRPLADVQIGLESVARQEVVKLEKRMILLKAVCILAPLFGLLGTILGAAVVFHSPLQTADAAGFSRMSEGIYSALLNSVAGLIVGIPAYLLYIYLVNRVRKVAYVLGIRSNEFMALLSEPARKVLIKSE